MSASLILLLAGALGLALALRLQRRGELARMSTVLDERRRLVEAGAAEAHLAHPVIDLSRCMGCGTCVAVCPEEGVLELVHGQAAVVRGSACRGISACERECPVGAVSVTLADLESRRDVPRVPVRGADRLEVPGRPGLFLAGEVTAHGLIRRAIEHGLAVAERVAARAHTPVAAALAAGGSQAGGAADGSPEGRPLDLVIVGAGPAGLACALSAQRAGLSYRLLDQAPTLGGAVAQYPRGKLVLTEPVELPGVGRLGARSYHKEELIELWGTIATDAGLALEHGQTLVGVEGPGPRAPLPGATPHAPWSATFEDADGSRRVLEADNLCLAIGRGGTPRRLGIPGEDSPWVTYNLVDAAALTGQRVLVVGGGEAAVEAALALAAQPGTRVTLVHRRGAFPRIASGRETALRQAADGGGLRLLLNARLAAVEPGFVRIEPAGDARHEPVNLPCEHVLILAGSRPAFELLEQAGVSFDPPAVPDPLPTTTPVTPRRRRLPVPDGFTLLTVLALLAPALFVWAQRAYFGLPVAERPSHHLHDLLRPGAGLGLGAGLLAVALVLANLAYLPRRAAPPRLRLGSLASWMRLHVATGLALPLLVLVHAGLAPRQTVGGHAFLALVVLALTGSIGRWLYAWLPRAANGRELALEEVRARLDQQGQHGELAAEALELVRRRQWGSSLPARLLALVGVRRDLARFEARVRAAAGDDPGAAELGALARLAYRKAILVAHLEDLRALASSWRYLHRWLAFLMVLFTALHVVHASAFGSVGQELASWFGGRP